MTAESIPLTDAVRLCQQAAAENMRRWWNPMTWQCRGCVRFSADVEHRCFAGPGNRGCRWVNARWDRVRSQLPQ